MRKNRWTWLEAVLILAAVAGCNRGGRAASLQGEVSFQGRPVPEGTIRLFPTNNTPGHGAGAAVAAGRYKIDVERGLFAGTYRVSLTACRKTGRQVPRLEVLDPKDSPMMEEIIQYLPAEYNDKSTLTVTLSPGENSHDFRLP